MHKTNGAWLYLYSSIIIKQLIDIVLLVSEVILYLMFQKVCV